MTTATNENLCLMQMMSVDGRGVTRDTLQWSLWKEAVINIANFCNTFLLENAGKMTQETKNLLIGICGAIDGVLTATREVAKN